MRLPSVLRLKNPNLVPADHTREEDCQHTVETVIQRFGRLNLLFNNAGVVLDGNAESITEADWALTFAVNVTAVWRMSRLVIPRMRANGGGAIVNNASDWGLVGAPNAVAYCASKGAVIQLTCAMALNHARENIRINAVCPGDTSVERWFEDGNFKGSGAVDRTKVLEERRCPPTRHYRGSVLQRGATVTSTQAGQPDANYGRWILPVIPAKMLDRPHNWYMTARKE